MDVNSYPDTRELRKIRQWPYNDFFGLMEYVKDRWKYSDCGYWRKKGNKYRISTGGWSGNESIIGALRRNTMFWMMCWRLSKVGGHYTFEVKKPAKKSPPKPENSQE